EKTRLLLDAFARRGALQPFVPFDVDESTLRSAAEAVAAEYPGVSVHAVVGDFERHLGLLPGGGRRMIAFLGSTIGNLDLEQRALFFAEIAATLEPGDTFLLGTDLVKDVGRLDALSGELTVAGLALLEVWTDPAGDFALSLSTPK